MKWFMKKAFEQDFSVFVRENEQAYPLYGFLSYLLSNQEALSLKVTITKRKNKEKIKEIRFQFFEEKEVEISMMELTLMGYANYLENPHYLIKTLQEDNSLQNATYAYYQAMERIQIRQNELNGIHSLMKNHSGLENHHHMANRRKIIGELIANQVKLSQQELNKGALVVRRLQDSYRDYLRQQSGEKNSEVEHADEKKSDASSSSPALDHIEVDLLTILKDPDITKVTKNEAKRTIEAYRKRKSTKESAVNQKEQSAQITLQTIQEHYLT